MVLQPPVTQSIREGARGSPNTISSDTKLAKNKSSMGLCLSWAVLCPLTHCTRVQLRMGEIICTGHPVPHSLNLTVEKNTFVCTGFLHNFIFWCFMWFQLSLVLFPLEGLPQPLSLSHRCSRVCLWCWLRVELVLPLMKKSSEPVFLFSPVTRFYFWNGNHYFCP